MTDYTNDTELADAVVALGIGERVLDKPNAGDVSYIVYPRQPEIEGHYTVFAFVRDWRVAGKCLEVLATHENDGTGNYEVQVWYEDDGFYVLVDSNHGFVQPLPIVNDDAARAIIEACAKALEK